MSEASDPFDVPHIPFGCRILDEVEITSDQEVPEAPIVEGEPGLGRAIGGMHIDEGFLLINEADLITPDENIL